MPKGGIPLRPPGRVAPAEPVPPAQFIIPLTPERESAMGPLGRKTINPSILETIRALRSRAVAETGERPMMLGAGTETEGIVAQDANSPFPPTAEVPEQLNPLQFGQPALPLESPPPAPPEPKEKKPADAIDPREVNPLTGVTTVGMEFRGSQLLLLDKEFMHDVWRQASAERRKFFDERRCGPIEWGGLATDLQVTQDVVIAEKPLRLVVKFRTISADDEYLGRSILMRDYASSPALEELGVLVTTAAASVVRLQDRVLPRVPSVLQEQDEGKRMDVMKQRVAQVLSWGFAFIRELTIQYAWFVRRVSRALQEGELGNG